MKLFLLAVAVVLIVVTEVRGQKICEQCVPQEDEDLVCAVADDNEITYLNNDTLHCNIICGLNVEYFYDGPCEKDSEEEPQELGGLTCDTCQIPLYPYDLYPVCTWVNGKLETYSTPRHAYCNGKCGVEAEFVRDGEC